MYDVLTFGNATVDVLLKSPAFVAKRDDTFGTGGTYHFPVGAKIPVSWQYNGIGGGAVNAAVTFARQNFTVGIVGEIGDDMQGQYVLASLVKERVKTSHLQIIANAMTAASTIFLHDNGERTIFSYRGSFSHADRQTLPNDIAAGWFYITSLSGDLAALAKILRYAHKNGTKVAFNPGVAELEQAALIPLLSDIDVLLVNHEEANYLVSKSADHQNRFVQLRKITRAIILITNGARGAAVSDGRKTYFMEAPSVHVADRLGAGDAFGSGFVAGLLRFDGNIIAAFQLATANAGSVCTQYGANAGILSHTDHILQNHVSEHWQ